MLVRGTSVTDRLTASQTAGSTSEVHCMSIINVKPPGWYCLKFFA